MSRRCGGYFGKYEAFSLKAKGAGVTSQKYSTGEEFTTRKNMERGKGPKKQEKTHAAERGGIQKKRGALFTLLGRGVKNEKKGEAVLRKGRAQFARDGETCRRYGLSPRGGPPEFSSPQYRKKNREKRVGVQYIWNSTGEEDATSSGATVH